MKISRLVGLILAAVLALNLMAATVASAAGPLFLPGTLNTFTGTSGTSKLESTSLEAITCSDDTTAGEITGAKTVGGVMVTFLGCHDTEKGGCTVKSKGAAEGTILTNTLDGELGTVKTTEAPSGVGLYLLPTTGTEFVDVEGPCVELEGGAVTGTIAGEATPIGKGGDQSLSLDGKLTFTGSKGSQSIKTINLEGGTSVKPKLKALGLIESSETTTELVTYTKDVEVC